MSIHKKIKINSRTIWMEFPAAEDVEDFLRTARRAGCSAELVGETSPEGLDFIEANMGEELPR